MVLESKLGMMRRKRRRIFCCDSPSHISKWEATWVLHKSIACFTCDK